MGKHAGKTVITEDIVRYIAALSRLSLEKEELSEISGQLAEILKYIDQLNEVDTEKTLPTTHVLSGMKNVFREDIPREGLSAVEALNNAPSKKENLFI